MITNADDKTFTNEVISSPIPTVVDFYTAWCGPCKTLSSLLEVLDGEYAGRIKIVKVNAEESLSVSASYGIMSMPTVYIFIDGQPQKALTGAISIETLRALIEKYL